VERIQGVAKVAYTVAFFALGQNLIRSRLRWLERYRRMGVRERAEERDRLFVRVYRFAWDHVPFYRRLYESAGLARTQVTGLRDLQQLPLVSKAMMKAVPLDDLRAPRWRAPGVDRISTSGSAGAPFVFYRSLALLLTNAAQFLSYLDLWHIPERRRFMFVLYNTDPTVGVPVRESTRFAPFSSAGSVRPDLPPKDLVRAIRDRRPDCVITYPSIIEEIVHTLARTAGDDATYPDEITFVTGGEVLTERLRAKIAGAFPRSRVFDTYNATETGMMAFECEHHNGLHVNDYAVVLEEGDRLTDADGTSYFAPVVTSLWSLGTPFIRYSGLEDLLATGPSRCACGFGDTVITRIIGRKSESLREPGGKSCSVGIMGVAHADLAGVERFQYVQTDPSALVFRYVPTPGADHAAIARCAEEATRKILGTAIEFSCEAVEQLEGRSTTLKAPMLVPPRSPV
jgi:phenylacetate-CoA ligase